MLMNNYSYVPILALKPAEMAALEELPNKDKALLLPLISLKKWANSKTFAKSLERIQKAFGNNYFIADIDKDFLLHMKTGKVTCSEELSKEILELASPSDGYKKWSEFVKNNEKIIPAIQFGDLSQLSKQIDNLVLANKLLVARFEFSGDNKISSSDFIKAVEILSEKKINNGLLFIFDYGDVNRLDLLEYYKYSKLIKRIYSLLPFATFSISGTSFPYSFAGSYRGEIPIYERQIYNKVSAECVGINVIYSDRASTRALSNEGGQELHRRE
ncbi:beta family protein [Leclercia adecarboxylata]|uniref:beta family protein n=1 Tax=Leclercia adecarboxylata TaxID=83655 RepID=UPI003D815727